MFLMISHRFTVYFSAMLNQLNWSSLRIRRDYLKVVLLYKLIKGLVIITPSPDLSYSTSVTRGHSCRLHVPPGVDCHLFSFVPSAIKLWNSLPSHLVEINPLEEFKRQLAFLTNINT